ncbi:MAG: FG-GAP repeat protein [Phycisphaerae bacterium]|nr:FG-GAP repeat protein [Phycisphaerae bacterium]
MFRINRLGHAVYVVAVMLLAASGAMATTETFKLTASDAAADDYFGSQLAISGNTAIVGAWGNDDKGDMSGSAYLFNATTGEEITKLTASDAAKNDYFGLSVAISDNTAIVGAPYNDGAWSRTGSAYLFDTTTGNQIAKLTASDAVKLGDFGISVAISGNVAIVGAHGDDQAGSYSGSAYLFNATTGEEIAKLVASDMAEGDRFGCSVAISGNTAIVGAYLDDDGGYNSGSVYLFDITTGEEIGKLTASDAAVDDYFGSPVAISDNIAIVGAWRNDDAGESSGSAYLYEVPEPASLVLLSLGGLVMLRRKR